MLVLGIEIPGLGSPFFTTGPAFLKNKTFSDRNARSAMQVIGIHLLFLAILMESVRDAFYLHFSLYNSLPNWLTLHQSHGRTPLNGFEIAWVLLLGFVERKLIFVESGSETDDTEPETDPS
jgi:hypothetical protein